METGMKPHTSYVTYDEAGRLTGSFLQTVLPEHEDNHIVVDDDLRLRWFDYQANAARDGLELAPVSVPAHTITVPAQVTAGQAREALYDAGLLNAIAPALGAITDPDTRWRAQNAWEYRPTVERNSRFVALMAEALGLTDEQLDQLFIDAAKL